MIGITAVKNRRLQMFTGFQLVAKVKRIEAAGHAHRIELSPFHGDPPGTRPRQRAKPYFAMLLAGHRRPHTRWAIVARNRKPRIGLMPGGPAVAFYDALSAVNLLLVQRPLPAPAASQVAQGVARGRQGP